MSREVMWALFLIAVALLLLGMLLSRYGERLRDEGLAQSRRASLISRQLALDPDAVIAEAQRAYRMARRGSRMMYAGTPVGLLAAALFCVGFFGRLIAILIGS